MKIWEITEEELQDPSTFPEIDGYEVFGVRGERWIGKVVNVNPKDLDYFGVNDYGGLFINRKTGYVYIHPHGTDLIVDSVNRIEIIKKAIRDGQPVPEKVRKEVQDE